LPLFSRVVFAIFFAALSVAAKISPAAHAQAPMTAPLPAGRGVLETPPDGPPVVVQGSVTANGKPLAYTVTTGYMPLKNAKGETEARVFYMAYTKRAGADGTAPSAPARPVMFSFNGGPGSSSVWLHLGALGPKRVVVNDDGSLPPPPYHVINNPETWLDFTDLVFIDPVGTGFSRAATPDLAAKYYGVRGDIASVGEFIRMYLTRNARWSSPAFLVGESYGTTRAAGLSDYLIEQGIALNGVLLISAILQFQTAEFDTGNDLPYALHLPTYTAIAHYHKRLAPDLEARPVADVVQDAEAWATGPYMALLAKGDALTPSERDEMNREVARYTGLSPAYVALADGRIEISRFTKELLRDKRTTVGRLDGRVTGRDASPVGETPDFDPSMSAIRPPYTAAFNDYVRNELGFKTDAPYNILGGRGWEWGAQNRYAEVGSDLAAASAKNPYLKVFVACGFYDLATPRTAARYTLSHLGASAPLRANVTVRDYGGGHMMYTHDASRKQLARDAAAFVQAATGGAKR